MEINALKIHPKDNVAVAIKPLKAGDRILGVASDLLIAGQDIPKNHKLALEEISIGGKIIKYGESIGLATKTIQPGQWVHTHNLKAED
jgi:hypothetical protein